MTSEDNPEQTSVTDDCDRQESAVNRREIEDRLDGCIVELDGVLHPQSDRDLQRAATLQGWIFALSWVLGRDPYDRSDEIMERWDDAE